MNFGEAIEAAKLGSRIAREGWNGKGMFVYLVHGSHDFKEASQMPDRIDGIRVDLFSYGDTGTSTRLPNLNMKSATGSTVTGWLASQTDILAEDWEVLPMNETQNP